MRFHATFASERAGRAGVATLVEMAEPVPD